ncbi:MAG: alpha/beta fold hydrolase [Proteobacteria bacterium]|nr:alpha/beta fold hydrolase [Pseudomonadota bacterium]
MPNVLLALLSREWIALAVGIALLVSGTAAPAPAPVKWACAIFGALLALGGLVNLTRISRARRRHPPQGKLCNLGGYRVHLLAEGSSHDRPPIVLFGGGHAAGAAMIHIHRALVQRNRSILIDRPGTGWSDTGPFPRTTAREAQEMMAALDAAGESGPFVFVGYSFGGLLAANMARRYPQRVAALVLLDPTPLETIVFGPRLAALRQMRTDELKTALARLIGWPADFARSRLSRESAGAAVNNRFEACLGADLERMRELEAGAGPHLANYSIYRELSPTGAAASGWETVVYDGDLGDLPVFLVAPGTTEEIGSLPEMRAAQQSEAQRMQRFFARTRERYLATSTRSQRVHAPPGSTHQFVYENPEFIVETLRGILESLPGSRR